jgi:pimeloyl-ACP methyl ester carboxylesterase
MISHRFENKMIVRSVESVSCRAILCYMHGLGESGLCFETLASHPLLSEYTHLIPDLPGYGKSPWNKQPLNVHQLGEHYVNWLPRNQTVPLFLIGHSMGGVIGQLIVEKHPDLFSGFVNIEGNITSGDCAFSSIAAGMSLEAFTGGGFDRMKGDIYKRGLNNPALRGYYASLRLADPVQYHANSRNLVKIARTNTAAKRLNELVIPYLYIAGSPNGICRESALDLTQWNVNSVTVSPSGHWPFIDQPESFIKDLTTYLDSCMNSP